MDIRRFKGTIIALMSILLIGVAFFTAGHAARPNFLDQTIGAALVPAQRGLMTITSWLISLPQYLRETAELLAENQELIEENYALREHSARLSLVEAELEVFSELLDIRQRYVQHPMIGAQVVASVSNNWFDSFTIDRGTSDGIERNMPVVAAGGLVGRVVMAGISYSRVVSYINIDEASAVSVRSVRTGEHGVVRGDIALLPEGIARMDHIAMGTHLAVGDELVTSNLGGIYPPGLLVGTISEIRTDINGLSHYALVTPSVDFTNVTAVMVITETFGQHMYDEGLE